MQALLTELAARPGCADSGSNTAYAPQTQVGEVFRNVTSLTVDGATGDLLIVDSRAVGNTYRIAVVSGEKVEVSLEPGSADSSSSS